MHLKPFIIKWCLSFLTDCIQHVKVDNTLSSTKSISTGTTQCCVSSPVLFTLYILISVCAYTRITTYLNSLMTLSWIYCTDTMIYHPTNLKWRILYIGVMLTTSFWMWRKLKRRCMTVRLSTTLSLIRCAPISSLAFTWQAHVDSLCCRLQQRLHSLRRLRVYGIN